MWKKLEPENLINNNGVFGDSNNYLNLEQLYFSYFGDIASLKIVDNIKARFAVDKIEADKTEEIERKHYKEVFDSIDKVMKYSHVFFIIKGGIIIKFFQNVATIAFISENEAQAGKST